MTQQNLKLVALSSIQEEPGALFARGFRTLGRMARGLPPALQMTQEFSEGHGIEDAVRGHAAFTGHFDAPEYGPAP